jgi:hypothetical protein
VERSYSGRRVQTILFHHRDAHWLSGNIEAARSLIASAISGRTVETEGYGRIVRGVPVEDILEFLNSYSIHEDSREMKPELLTGYIKSQVERAGELVNWNLVVMGLRTVNDRLGEIDFGFDEPVAAINRSRVIPKLGVDEATANIKALTTATDVLADFPDLRRSALGGHNQFIRERTQHAPGVGAVLIYPISRHSVPERKPPQGRPPSRMALDAVDEVIGMSLVFPESSLETVGRSTVYYSAPPLEVEYLELPQEAAE